MDDDKTTFKRILYDLKSRGAATAGDIATRYGLTLMGAHKALQVLVDKGFVQFEDQAQGRGRPSRRFSLTAKGHAHFPDRHADMTLDLINNVRKIFGDEGLAKLIAAREAEQVARYQTPAKNFRDRVEALAQARAAEGYMARIEPGETPGEWFLIEDHCPICAAASACQGFCRSELAVFSEVLGPDVEIERQEHLLNGGRRCTYRLSEKQPA